MEHSNRLMKIYWAADYMEAHLTQLNPLNNILDIKLLTSLISLHGKSVLARKELNRILNDDSLMEEFDKFSDKVDFAFEMATDELNKDAEQFLKKRVLYNDSGDVFTKLDEIASVCEMYHKFKTDESNNSNAKK